MIRRITLDLIILKSGFKTVVQDAVNVFDCLCRERGIVAVILQVVAQALYICTGDL